MFLVSRCELSIQESADESSEELSSDESSDESYIYIYAPLWLKKGVLEV